MVSDETAYRKYLAGDEAAAQLLVERYGDALTLYINGVLGDIHEAEDLMIEAFAHIFARERPIQDGCFKAYLYKTGRNLALRCKTRRRCAAVPFALMKNYPYGERKWLVTSPRRAGSF